MNKHKESSFIEKIKSQYQNNHAMRIGLAALLFVAWLILLELLEK